MLSTFAFEANVPFELFDPDGEQANLAPIILEALREKTLSDASYRILFTNSKRNMQTLLRKVASLMQREGQLPELPDLHKVWEEKFLPFSIEEFLELARSLKGLCNRAGEVHEHFIKQMQALNASPDSFEALLGQKSALTYFHSDFLKKKAEGTNLGVFEKLRENLLPLLEKGSNPDRIATSLAALCKKRFKESEQFSHQTLLDSMLTALSKPQFAKSIEKKYRAGIIDEFQDTDPKQWQIFRTLFLKKDAFFCLVGDPKQSIYSFRGADLDTYFAAQKEVGGEYALATNYRSDPALIDALNDFFKMAPPELGYVSVHAGKKENYKFSDKKGPLHIFQSDEDESIWFPYIAKEIHSLVQQGISLDEIALLIRDRYQAERLEHFLKRSNISAKSNATASLGNTRVFVLFERLFAALKSPRHVKEFLGDPLIDLPFDDLARGIDDEAMQNLYAIFRELEQLYKERGLSVALESFLETNFNGSTLFEHLVHRGHLDDYSDGVQIIDLLMKRESKSPMQLGDVIDYLKSIKTKRAEEEPSLRRNALREGAGVSIMTTFMSKGLEFDVVFALDAASRTTAKESIIGYGGKLHFREEAPFEAVQTLQNEKLRKLYVAMTRAKHRLYLPHFIYEKEVEPFAQSPIEAFGWSGQPHEVLTEQKIYIPAPEKSEAVLPELVNCHIPEKSVSTLSFSSIAKPSNHPLSPPEGVLPVGAHTGTLFHYILENIISRGFYQKPALMHEYIASELISTHLEPWAEEVHQIIEKAFALPLSGFTLMDVAPHQMFHEMEFLFPQDENTDFKGFIDLLFCHNDEYYILDWKTNYLPSYDNDSLKSAMQSHDYFLQASIYTKAINRYLATFTNKQVKEVYYLFLRAPKVYKFL